MADHVLTTVNYLSEMTSVAALLSWICMLITYLSWYRGARIAMKEREGFSHTEEAKFIRDHRGFLQPYVSNVQITLSVAGPRINRNTSSLILSTPSSRSTASSCVVSSYCSTDGTFKHVIVTSHHSSALPLRFPGVCSIIVPNGLLVCDLHLMIAKPC